MSVQAVILGCSGYVLTPDEISFFRAVDPWGFILFKRNVDNPAQIRALCSALRELTGRDDTPILVDQEGGRVQRMGPPHWPVYPSGRAYGDLYARDEALGIEMAETGACLMAADLRSVGITVDCLPILDVPVAGAHDVIGNRAYGLSPDVVSVLGRSAALGLLKGGVLPVIKHIPGHGRASVDSHLSLPVVDATRADLYQDFKPFRDLADMPLAMTAHVIYSAIDATNPATTSSVVVKEIIRNDIGYDGLVMSDDLSMKALSGTLGERASAVFAAGCDIALHCNGIMEEMRAVVESVPPLSGKATHRAAKALNRIAGGPESMDLNALRNRFNTFFASQA